MCFALLIAFVCVQNAYPQQKTPSKTPIELTTFPVAKPVEGLSTVPGERNQSIDGFRMIATMPAEKTKQLKSLLDMEINSISISVDVFPEHGGRKIQSAALPVKQTYRRPFRKVDTDYRFRYEPFTSYHQGNTFVSTGIYRFQNLTEKTEYFVQCEVKGVIDDKGQMQCEATWSGPSPHGLLNANETKIFALLFFEKDGVAK